MVELSLIHQVEVLIKLILSSQINYFNNVQFNKLTSTIQ